MEQPIRAWHIGEYGEIYAGRCTDEEIKQWFREQISSNGDHSEADEQIAECFEEISQDEMDRERDWHSDDVPDGESADGRSNYRKEAEGGALPCQISTQYN